MAQRAEAVSKTKSPPLCSNCTHWKKQTEERGGCAFWEKRYKHPMRFAEDSCGYWERRPSAGASRKEQS